MKNDCARLARPRGGWRRLPVATAPSKNKKTAKPRGTKISHSFAEKLRHAETWGFNHELNSVHQKKRLSRSRPMQFLLHAGRKEVRKTSNCAGCDRFSCVWWASKSSQPVSPRMVQPSMLGTIVNGFEAVEFHPANHSYAWLVLYQAVADMDLCTQRLWVSTE